MVFRCDGKGSRVLRNSSNSLSAIFGRAYYMLVCAVRVLGRSLYALVYGFQSASSTESSRSFDAFGALRWRPQIVRPDLPHAERFTRSALVFVRRHADWRAPGAVETGAMTTHDDHDSQWLLSTIWHLAGPIDFERGWWCCWFGRYLLLLRRLFL